MTLTQDAPMEVVTISTTSRKRVLHVLVDLAVGGGQRLVEDLVRYTDRNQFDVFVAYVGDADDLVPHFEALGVEPIALTGRGTVAKLRSLRRVIRENHIDLVHVHSGVDRKYGQVAALLTRRPVISHLHSPWNHRGSQAPYNAGPLLRFRSTLLGRVRDGIENRTVRQYIAAGDAVAEFHAPFVRRPIVVANNGVDLQTFAERCLPSESAAFRAQWDIPQDAKVLVYVARLVDGKGQDLLIQAMRAIPDVHLLIVGGGPLYSELLNLAQELGVANRTHFTGQSTDVIKPLCASDVFVFTSVSEGVPLSMLEAMAVGLPVVACELPGLDSIIQDGKTGFSVKQGDLIGLIDQIQKVLDNPELAAKVGRNEQALIAKSHDVQHTTRKVECVYRKVLGI